MATDTSAMMENLLTAIDIIAEKKVESLPYDKTLTCTIVSAAKAARGEYSVTDGTTTFLAYSDNTTYKNGTRVYVTVPNGDFNNRKLIKGKYVSGENEAYNYVSPLDNFLDITGNIYGYNGSDVAVTDKTGLIANHPTNIDVLLWSIGRNNVTPQLGAHENKLTELDLNQYTRLGIGASFSTRLNGVIAGHYGLRLELITEVAQNDAIINEDILLRDVVEGRYTLSEDEQERVMARLSQLVDIYGYNWDRIMEHLQQTTDSTVLNDTISTRGKTEFKKYIFELDASKMFGNPYHFIVSSKQEALFDIGAIGETIVGAQAYFYQTPGTFKDSVNSLYPVANYNNLFIQDVIVTFGYDVNEYTEDTVLCYTTSPTTYVSTSRPAEELSEINKKIIQSRWIHRQEDGTFYAIDEANEIPKYTIDNNTSIPMATVHWYRYTLRANIGDAIAGPQWEEITNTNSNPFILNFTPDPTLAAERLKVIVEYPSQEYVDDTLKSSPKLAEIIEDINSLTEQFNETQDEQERAQIEAQLTATYAQYNKIAAQITPPATYYTSAILELTNESEVSNRIDADLVQGLQLECDGENENGKYYLYTDNGRAIGGAASKFRYLRARYNSILSFSDEDVPEMISWYIPLDNTMIAPPKEGVTYNIKDKDPNFVPELSGEQGYEAGIYNRFMRITRKGKGILYDDATKSHTDTYATNNVEQIFQIKDQYISTYKNNTIYCEVVKNNLVYTKSITLEFGYGQKQGTKYTFNFEASDEAMTVDFGNNNTVQDSENNIPITITPHIYDYSHNEVTEQYLDKIYYSWYCCKPDQQNFSTGSAITTDLVQQDGSLLWQSADGEKGSVTLSPTPGAAITDMYYYILQAQVTSTFGDLDGNPHSITLVAYYPVAIRRYDEHLKYIHFEGDSLISYSSAGTNPIYFKESFKVHPVNVDEATYIIPLQQWKVAVYDSLTSGSTTKRHYYNVNTPFYPRFIYSDTDPLQDNLLLVPSLYMNGIQKYVSALGYNKGTSTIVWIQPMIINQYGYESEMLNSWDGNLTIDENNDTILSAMVGAGVKNSDNTFSGVLMGQLSKANLNQNDYPIGLYGFNKGNTSFGFKVDGTAFLGKSGKGQILFNGNKGTISSQNYAIGNGMNIDIDDGILEIKKERAQKVLITPNSDGYLQIFATIKQNGQNVQKELIHIADNEYYLQTVDFNELQGGNESGIKLDLASGKITAYRKFEILAYKSPSTDQTTANNGGWIWINSDTTKDYPLSIGTGTLAKAYFKVKWDGTLYATKAILSEANVDVDSGTIGNWILDPGAGHLFYAAGASPSVDNAVAFLSGTGKANNTFNESHRLDANLLAKNSATSLVFKAGNNFGVDSSGTLYAINAHVSGNITSSSGTIGGWNISTTALYHGSENAPTHYLGVAKALSVIGSEKANIVFKAGTGFGVDSNGKLYSNSGSIGGWTIGTDSLSHSNNSHYLGSGLSDVTINGYKSTSSDPWVFKAGSNFGVTSSGKLYAKDAVLSGNITANSGTIGGVSIASDGKIAGNMYAAMESLIVDKIQATNISADHITSGTLDANTVTVSHLYASDIGDFNNKVETIVANKISATTISAEKVQLDGYALNTYLGGGVVVVKSVGANSGAIWSLTTSSTSTVTVEGTAYVPYTSTYNRDGQINGHINSQTISCSIDIPYVAFDIKTTELLGLVKEYTSGD